MDSSSSNAVNEGGSHQYNPHTSQVPISNFVSIKLSGETDYLLWKEQMTCLLEYHDMLGFINDSMETNKTIEKYSEWKKSDKLVKGWIYATLSRDVISTVVGLDDAYKVWDKLKNTYDKPVAEILGAEGSHQDLQLSQVCISNFVSIKMSGESNYNMWKKQMMCLLEYHHLVGFIDGTIRNPMDAVSIKRNPMDDGDGDDDDDDDDENKVEMTTKFKKWNKSTDTLVKGWIFGTLSEDVLETVLNLHNAYSVWEKLKDTYMEFQTFEGAGLYTEKQISYLEKEKVGEAKYIALHRAIVKGEWDKAQEFFTTDKDALTAKINLDGDTPLHLAVYTCPNLQFVENLLKKIEPASLPTLLCNDLGYTALHYAAVFGNTKAAKMLVEKNPCLLFVADVQDYLPILKALFNSHEKTFLYLLEVCKLHIDLSQNDGYQNPFEGTQGSSLLHGAISRGYVDIAYELICAYPNLAMLKDENVTPLWVILNNEDLYFSATQYNSYQKFVYSHVPAAEKISENDNGIPDIENPGMYNTTFIVKCTRSCFYPVIKRIYLSIWEAALLHENKEVYASF